VLLQLLSLFLDAGLADQADILNPEFVDEGEKHEMIAAPHSSVAFGSFTSSSVRCSMPMKAFEAAVTRIAHRASPE
jgi:hypothetical protein